MVEALGIQTPGNTESGKETEIHQVMLKLIEKGSPGFLLTGGVLENAVRK